MLIATCTGSENFETGSAKSHLFLVPDRPGDKEVHIGVAAKNGKGNVRTIGAGGRVGASRTIRQEIAGTWSNTNYDVPEGRVLKLFGTRSGGWGSVRVQANLLLRLRATAPLYRVGAILTGHPSATYNRAVTEGRFDILGLDEALALGVPIPTTFRHSFEDVMTRRMFEIVQVERESAAAPQVVTTVVENSQGEQVAVTVRRRGRALDL